MKTLKECYAEGIAKALYFEQRRLENSINDNIELINNLQIQDMDADNFYQLAKAKMELKLAYLALERLKKEIVRQDENTRRILAIYIIEQEIWEKF
jgi:hypothetical protein